MPPKLLYFSFDGVLLIAGSGFRLRKNEFAFSLSLLKLWARRLIVRRVANGLTQKKPSCFSVPL